MRLFEFDASPLLVKLVASISQLKSNIDAGNEKPNWTIDELLKYFRENDIVLAKDDLYNMIQQKPLKSYIKNIQADEVVFKGQETDSSQPEDQKKDVVAKMAQQAMK